MQEILQRIDAAAIDGRAHNIRYRQQQLQQFSIRLQENADKICEAITLDSGFDEGEAVFEFAQSIKAVRTLYEQLDLQAALDEEYSVANNKDNISARVPVGVVVIRPGQHGRLFSVVSPVAAALAAGNCVIVEIPSSLGHLDSLLRSELTNLDSDAFAIVTEPITVSALSSDCIVVDQSVSGTVAGPGLVSNSKALTVAIVDRTANVEQAANEICRARFRFKGRSPYAPDVILVNEWVRDEFVSACLKIVSVQAASAKSARKPGAALNGHTSHHSRNDIKVLFDSCGFQLVEGTQRAEVAKVSDCTLTMVPVTSLVDSVNIASSMTNRSLAACYCFGDLKSAKFLGQFIGASITFVNGIPNELLIGPIRPTTALSPEDVNMR
ncbi:hypothetical protein G7054_g10160 [Neopestalotiopsis clavispora]|nr:hypothetical protein G7054_g10160 [Neopestalotiopsis clavispora]